MIYLEKEDLIASSFERFIDESSGDKPAQGETIDDVRQRILDQTELKCIDIVKTAIGTKYDVDAIFDEDEPIKNEMLVDILVKFMLYKIVRRNAARKVPTDYKEDYTEAKETLEKIATGRIPLSGLPIATDGDGNPLVSQSVWGNNKNDNFYI